MKTHTSRVPSASNAVLQATSMIPSPLPQRMNLRIGSVSLRGFGRDAGPRFQNALKEAILQGIQQRRELSFTNNIQLDHISIPPLAAGATVEDAARQVARGLLRTLEKQADKSNEKGEGAHG